MQSSLISWFPLADNLLKLQVFLYIIVRARVAEVGCFQLQHSIHPKRLFPRFQESADNFEFSAERLSEIAKSIKITLFA